LEYDRLALAYGGRYLPSHFGERYLYRTSRNTHAFTGLRLRQIAEIAEFQCFELITAHSYLFDPGLGHAGWFESFPLNLHEQYRGFLHRGFFSSPVQLCICTYHLSNGFELVKRDSADTGHFPLKANSRMPF